jgi:hypothetical protein
MEVQEQVLPLLEQEALPLEAHRLNPQGQGLPQEVQVQQEEVLLQGQEALLVLAKVREQIQLLEALLRAQAGVLAQVEEEVLDLALAVGLRQAVGPQGQVELVREQAQAKEQALAEALGQALAMAEERE